MDLVQQESSFKSYGYVNVLEIMGSDAAITEAARVSVNRSAKDPAQIAPFILSLARKGHWKPFEFGVVKLKIQCPIFVARQWRTHSGSYMELSRRYSSEDIEFYLPDDELLNNCSMSVVEAYVTAEDQYRHLLSMSVPREIARTVLPVGMFTTFMWVTNVRDLMFFLKQRLASDAQAEILAYADDVYQNVLLKYFPACAAAFEELIKKV